MSEQQNTQSVDPASELRLHLPSRIGAAVKRAFHGRLEEDFDDAGYSCALLGPAATGQKPAARTLLKALRKSPAGQETNSSSAFLSLCHPTPQPARCGDQASAVN
jgi:hypothetical protein